MKWLVWSDFGMKWLIWSDSWTTLSMKWYRYEVVIGWSEHIFSLWYEVTPKMKWTWYGVSAPLHSADSNYFTDDNVNDPDDLDDEIKSDKDPKVYQKRGCNFPFRGKKSTFLEGGTLSPTIVWSSSSKRIFPKATNTNLVHIVDWFLTILKLAGLNSIKSEMHETLAT